MQKNPFILWLVENFKRIATKSPKFFQIWSWISGLLTALTGLPVFIHSIAATAHLQLPEAWTAIENRSVALLAAGVFFMSLFPTQAPVAAVTPSGDSVKVGSKEALPFTAAQEVKEAKKEAAKTNDTVPIITTSVTVAPKIEA